MSSFLKARGLYTFPNSLSEAPPGALREALNIVIDRNSVIEPRRGLAQFGNTYPLTIDRTKQLFTYKKRILRHYDDKLQFDSTGNGDFLTFDGAYPEVEAGLRIKSVESNGNFYFTTINGVKKIAAIDANSFTTSPGYIIDAGGIEALDGEAFLNPSQAGFFSANSSVAYRIVWGYTDANENLILGVPSPRIIVVNPTANSGVVDLSFTVPQEINNTNYFYQIYRSALVTNPDIPSDELNLVIQENITSAEILAGEVNITDFTPDDFRQNGTPLYINPSSGDGIESANYAPPICKDLTLYKNQVFYANTKTIENLNLALLSVDSFVSGSSSITISDGINPDQTYTFVGVKEITNLNFDTQANTNDGGYFFLYSANDERKYAFWADKTGTTPAPISPDIVGSILVKVDLTSAVTDIDVAQAFATVISGTNDFDVPTPLTSLVTVTTIDNGMTTDASDSVDNPLGGPAFSITIFQQGEGEDQGLLHVLLSALPTVGQSVDETARSLIRVINRNPNSQVYASYLSGPTDVPGLILLQGRGVDSARFYITASDSTTGAEFNPTLPTSGQDVISDNEEIPNRIYYSKFQQPEAVPLVNFIDVGPKDQEIKRVIGLRDALFILKEDGIYRLTGENSQFVVSLFDASSNILAADSAAVLNNQIYMLSVQGIVSVTDNSVNVMSRPIEDKIKKIANPSYQYKTATFGVGYEEDRAYIMWTVTQKSDTIATQCYRYNTFTDSWTRWDVPATCGIVNAFNNKLYIGAGNDNYIKQERKNLDETDYADIDFDRLILNNALNGKVLSLSSIVGIEEGDMLVQTQWVTINQFNKVLKMLDNDILVSDNDYYDTLHMVPGDNLTNKIQLFVNKLNADPALQSVYSFSGTTDQELIQVEFNVIIDTLNNDPGAFFTNYPSSEGTIDRRVPVESIVLNTNKLNLAYEVPLIVGTITVYKAIKSDTIYHEEFFQDPSFLKQVRESTMLFENNLFRNAEISYSTDLSPGFEAIDFNGSVSGLWGGYYWGDQNWGGDGNEVPLRTYIPINKQRCRFIYCRFKHNNAYEKYSILGVSFEARTVSERAYF